MVEGPIGVGKTSLARRLAHSLGYSIEMEQPQENPFLERFYREPRRYALSTQLHFLFSRMAQMDELGLLRKQGRLRCVCDYLIDKEPLFAQINLDTDEFELYRRVFSEVSVEAPVPDLVIYLQASVPVLEERIRRRGVSAEQIMSRDYLQRICDTFTHHFMHYTDAPLLVINAESINFVDNDSDYQSLLSHALGISNGRHFFNPLPNKP